jgi:hypothetical protein
MHYLTCCKKHTVFIFFTFNVTNSLACGSDIEWPAEEMPSTPTHESSDEEKTSEVEKTLKRSLMEDILENYRKRTKHDGNKQ